MAGKEAAKAFFLVEKNKHKRISLASDASDHADAFKAGLLEGVKNKKNCHHDDLWRYVDRSIQPLSRANMTYQKYSKWNRLSLQSENSFRSDTTGSRYVKKDSPSNGTLGYISGLPTGPSSTP